MARVYVKNLSEATIIGVARTYLKKAATMESVGEEFHFTPNMISKILYRGVAEDILTDALANDVIYKIVHAKEIGQFQRQQRWNQALAERQALREAKANEALKSYQESFKLEELEAKEQELIYKIESYADFALDPDAPSLAELEEQLTKVQDKIQELQNN